MGHGTAYTAAGGERDVVYGGVRCGRAACLITGEGCGWEDCEGGEGRIG